ncbi:MAG: TRCF domain-containing protein, partial [Shewanella sp.]
QGKEPSLAHMLNQQCEIELRIPALLPEAYVGDVNIRLSLYKRIAGCHTEAALDELKVELIDRFGLLPDATKNLLEMTLYKHQATHLGLSKIEVHAKGGSLEFNQDNCIDPGFIIGLLQNQPQIYRMDGPNKLKFSLGAETAKDRLALVKLLLEQLSQHRLGDK